MSKTAENTSDNRGGTIDPAEVAQFAALAEQWWDETGPFRPLHRFNPVRLGFLRQVLTSHFDGDRTSLKPLSGLRLLDVGCGGGLISEPLCRMGADVTGLDAAEQNIAAARLHAEQMDLPVCYIHGAAEALAEQGRQFDAVIALEIIEHVADTDLFVEACAQLIRPGGLLIAATLNRTPKSLLTAKFGAEYVLRWLPVGTHDWRKFVRPSEMSRLMEQHGLMVTRLQGVSFNPLSGQWALSEDLSVNYMAVAYQPAHKS